MMKKNLLLLITSLFFITCFLLLLLAKIPRFHHIEKKELSKNVDYITPIKYGNLYRSYEYDCTVELGPYYTLSGTIDDNGVPPLGVRLISGTNVLGNIIGQDIIVKTLEFKDNMVIAYYYIIDEIKCFCDCELLDFPLFLSETEYSFRMGNDYTIATLKSFEYESSKIFFSIEDYNFSDLCSIEIIKMAKNNVFYISNEYLVNCKGNNLYVFNTRYNGEFILEIEYFNSLYSIVKNKNISTELEVIL